VYSLATFLHLKSVPSDNNFLNEIWEMNMFSGDRQKSRLLLQYFGLEKQWISQNPLHVLSFLMCTPAKYLKIIPFCDVSRSSGELILCIYLIPLGL
jgi:hypothetical protein